jgi:hypothetical protein
VLRPDAAAIDELAARHRILLFEVTPRRSSLEEVNVQMTDTSVECWAGTRHRTRPTSATSRCLAGRPIP